MNRAARAVLVAAVTLIWSLAGVGMPSLVGGDPGRPPMAAAVEDQTEPPTLTLTSISPGTLRPGQPLNVGVTLRAGTAPIPEGSQVELRMQRTTLGTRYAVNAWGEAAPGRSVGAQLTTQPLTSEVPASGVRALTLTVPAETLRLPDTPAAFGPRGIAVVLRAPDYSRAAVLRSHLVWFPAGATASPLAATVVVPLTAGPPDPRTGLPGAATLATATEPSGRLTALLATVGPGVTPALDPSLLTGQTTNTQVQAWRAQLNAQLAGREVVVLPSADADVVSLAAARATALLQLARQQATEQASALPSSAQANPDIALPADGQLGPMTVKLLADTGYEHAVLRESTVPPLREQVTTPTGLATVEGDDGSRLTAFLADDTLSDLLAESGRDDGRGAVITQQQVLADTAAIARENPGYRRHVLLSAPVGWDPSTGGRAMVASLMSAPWITPGQLSDLARQPVPEIERRAAQVSEDSAGGQLPDQDIAEVHNLYTDAVRDAGVAENPQNLVNRLAQPSVGMLSRAWRDRADWRAAFANYQGVTGYVADSVQVIEGSTVTQVSQEVRLPVTVGNNLDQRVRVKVVARPTSSRLQVTEPEQDVELAGQSRTVVYLPVRGVGNGEAGIEVALQTLDGHQLGPPSTVSVVVRADWENRVTLGLAAVCGVVLVVGIFRTLRRGRTRAQAIVDHAGEAPSP